MPGSLSSLHVVPKEGISLLSPSSLLIGGLGLAWDISLLWAFGITLVLAATDTLVVAIVGLMALIGCGLRLSPAEERAALVLIVYQLTVATISLIFRL